MNKYKVEICNSPNWQSFETATLGVSIESPNLKGEKLEAILDFAAKRFKFLRIDVTDVLYRHKFSVAGLDEETSFHGAQALGALWLAQHADLINSCPIEKEIIRWDEWIKHPEYSDTFEKFQFAFDSNDTFREAIFTDIETFHHRHKKNVSSRMLEKSLAFLIEEVVVISLQAKETKSVRLYPGEELSCMKVVRENLVPEAPNWLQNEQFARMRLKLRDSYKASNKETAFLSLCA